MRIFEVWEPDDTFDRFVADHRSAVPEKLDLPPPGPAFEGLTHNVLPGRRKWRTEAEMHSKYPYAIHGKRAPGATERSLELVELWLEDSRYGGGGELSVHDRLSSDHRCRGGRRH